MSHIIVIGSGGHAKVVCDALKRCDSTPLMFTDANPDRWGQTMLGVAIQGSDELIDHYSTRDVLLANGLASIKDTKLRKKIYEIWTGKGYQFITIRHPDSIIAEDVEIGAGSQVLAGAILQPSAVLGENVIVNTKSSIDHDCVVGSHCHIAPGATISGFANIGSGVHIGTCATVIQNISIGDNSLVAAGAVVVTNVPENSIVMGVPGIVKTRLT